MNVLRATLRTFLRLLWHPLCRHSETLTKTAGTRVYTECLRCEYQSKGVEIAGHDYASTKHSWEPAPSAVGHMRKVSTAIYTSKAVPPVAIAPEPTTEYLRTSWGEQHREFTITPLPLGNLAGHATSTRRKSPSSLCNKCGEPKEITRPKSNLCRACDAVKVKRLPRLNRYQRKISVKSVRKTSRKPSSKRSTTA